MTIAAQDLELIKRELSGIREFYDARINTEIPPLKEEMDRISGQLNKAQQLWRELERESGQSIYLQVGALTIAPGE